MTSRRAFLASSAAFGLAFAGASAGCTARQESGEQNLAPRVQDETVPPPPTEDELAAARVPEDLWAKAATLTHVGVNNYDDALAKAEMGVGGIFIPSWADPGLLTVPGRDLHALRAMTERSFQTSIDFEGGRVQRHSFILGEIPSAQVQARDLDPAGVEGLAFDVGRRLHAHGITMDFAPVLDVGGADLDVIGDRSFSTDPNVVGDYGAAFARGLGNAAVTPVYKHFPGHGRASGDTHVRPAVTPPLEELALYDLVCFSRAFHTKLEPVMVGHIVVPGLGDAPSSLNPEAYRLLREGDYPDGVPCDELAITDDLTGMKAITDLYSLPEAAVNAISAGADQVLWSADSDPNYVIAAIVAAVESGRIPMERIDSAALRVQRQLMRSGL